MSDAPRFAVSLGELGEKDIPDSTLASLNIDEIGLQNVLNEQVAAEKHLKTPLQSVDNIFSTLQILKIKKEKGELAENDYQQEQQNAQRQINFLIRKAENLGVNLVAGTSPDEIQEKKETIERKARKLQLSFGYRLPEDDIPAMPVKE